MLIFRIFKPKTWWASLFRYTPPPPGLGYGLWSFKLLSIQTIQTENRFLWSAQASNLSKYIVLKTCLGAGKGLHVSLSAMLLFPNNDCVNNHITLWLFRLINFQLLNPKHDEHPCLGPPWVWAMIFRATTEEWI